jgi:hypothetical protein
MRNARPWISKVRHYPWKIWSSLMLSYSSSEKWQIRRHNRQITFDTSVVWGIQGRISVFSIQLGTTSCKSTTPEWVFVRSTGSGPLKASSILKSLSSLYVSGLHMQISVNSSGAISAISAIVFLRNLDAVSRMLRNVSQQYVRKIRYSSL